MRRFMGSTLIGVLAALCIAATVPSDTQGDTSAPVPSTDYTPDQVIGIVIDALKHNDSAAGDEGIATVYRFASPANRAVTGPLPRFTAMIKQGYGEMLNHRSSRRSPVEIRGGVALQAVWLTTPDGIELAYVFRLGLQKNGAYAGMWMTDAVYPLGEGEQDEAI